MEYCRLQGVWLQAWSALAQGISRGKLDDQPENEKETAFSVRKYAGFNEPQRLFGWPGDSRLVIRRGSSGGSRRCGL
jgi:hypothetical protein